MDVGVEFHRPRGLERADGETGVVDNAANGLVELLVPKARVAPASQLVGLGVVRLRNRGMPSLECEATVALDLPRRR